MEVDSNKNEIWPIHKIVSHSSGLVCLISGNRLLPYSLVTNEIFKLTCNCNIDFIRMGCFDSTGQWFLSAEEKNLKLWDTRNWTLVSTREIIKKVTSIGFGLGDNSVLWSDKFGCINKVPIEKFQSNDPKDESNQQLVLGHCSIITHMSLCNYKNSHLIVSTDRDEKIRVSRYPDGFDTISYCLGHRSFVSSIVLIEHTPDEVYAISGGGDGMLITWSLISGKQLNTYTFNSQTQDTYITDIVYSKKYSLIAVLYEGIKLVQIFSVIIPSGILNLLSTPELPSIPLSLTALNGEYLYISTLEHGIKTIPLSSQGPFDIQDTPILNEKLKLSDISVNPLEDKRKTEILPKLSLSGFRKNQSKDTKTSNTESKGKNPKKKHKKK